MNSTNRALNRLFILAIGVVLLAAGAAAIGLAIGPGWTKIWNNSASTVRKTLASTFKDTVLMSTGPSWVLIVIPIVALALIAVLFVFIFRQGGGRTVTLLDDRETRSDAFATDGFVTIDAAVAEGTLEEALAGRTDLVSSKVSTYRVKSQTAMKITVTPRRGASPKIIQRRVEETLSDWDAVLGRKVPTFIHVKSGLRTKIAKTTRIQ